MRQHRVFFFGHELGDVPLNRPRRLRLCQPEALTQTCDVGIHRDAWQAKGIAADDERGFTPHPRQGGELINAAGNDTIKVPDQLFTCLLYTS